MSDSNTASEPTQARRLLGPGAASERIQGPEGKAALHAEPVDRADAIPGAGSVRPVHFLELRVRS